MPRAESRASPPPSITPATANGSGPSRLPMTGHSVNFPPYRTPGKFNTFNTFNNFNHLAPANAPQPEAPATRLRSRPPLPARRERGVRGVRDFWRAVPLDPRPHG